MKCGIKGVGSDTDMRGCGPFRELQCAQVA